MNPNTNVGVPGAGEFRNKGPKSEASPLPNQGSLTEETKVLATEAAAKAKDLLAERVTEQKEKAGVALGEAATALRGTADKLAENPASPFVEKTADRLDQASDYLRTSTPDQILRTAKTFAWREPVLFLTGAFAMGVLAARFLKSSASHEMPSVGGGT
jgi:hypothetical protein